MKKFLSGVLCATIVFSLTLSALAISGRMTIEVDPINIMVNGEVFVPKDVNGKEVPQFAYQGTTYAPLRALAEAYGLEVGYDAEKNMATVNDPNNLSDTTTKVDMPEDGAQTPSYDEFKAMWEVVEPDEYGYEPVYANYIGDMNKNEFISYWGKMPELFEQYCVQYIAELNPDGKGTQMYYQYDGHECAYAVEHKDGLTHFANHFDYLDGV